MTPHPPISAHYSSSDAKPAFVNRLFDQGARHYDGVVNWGFLHSGSYYRRWVQQRHGLKPGLRVLDVACGTGLVAVEAARILGSARDITCLDPSSGMLAEARKKLDATFVQGYAESLPFPDNSFDFLTMGYALRHVQDPVAETLLRGQVPDGSTLSVDVDPSDVESFVLSTRAP